MRWPVLLVCAQVAGILWADRGGFGPSSLAVAQAALLDRVRDELLDASLVVSLVALTIALIVAWLVARLACGSRRVARRPSRIAWRVGCRGVRAIAVLGVCALGFASGERGLERALAIARRGAALAETDVGGSFRRVDAWVAARRPTPFGDEVELVGVRPRPGESAVPERLLLALDGDRSAGRRSDRLLWPGAAVRLGLRIAPLHPARNPGTPDRAQALARRGFGARARLVKPDWVALRSASMSRASLAASLARGRQALADRLAERLAEREGSGLVRALSLGDRRGVPRSTREAFRALGLAHLLSVSGLHIGFVALPTARAVAWIRLRARPRGSPTLGFAGPAVAGCVAALAYAWLTGASTPALRASLVFVLLATAGLLARRLDPAPALAWAAIALLGFDPASLFDLGAQLSFGACAALIAAGIWRAPSTDRSPTVALRAAVAPWLVEPVAASLAISLALLPLAEANGLPRAWPSPLVNALAIPWTGFAVMPCSLLAGLLAFVPASRLVDGASSLLLLPAAALERACVAGFETWARAAGAVESAGRLPWAFGLALVAVGLVALRGRRVAWAVLVWCVVGGLGLAPREEAGFGAGRPRVVFFDVGQADAALIETAESAWLIDTGSGPPDGSGGATLVRALRSLGVRRLDVIVVTHADLDHRGGAARLLEALPVGELWLASATADDPAFASLVDRAGRRGTVLRRVAAGDRRVADGGLVVEVLWPPPTDRKPVPRRPRNDQSIVLSLVLEGRRLLFMGDVGEDVEAALVEGGGLGPVDVLKAGHHGSRSSTGPALLAAVSPQRAVVSAPCDSARGLPNAQTLERLVAARARIAWTGRDGALALHWSGAAGAPLLLEHWGSVRTCAAAFARRGARSPL